MPIRIDGHAHACGEYLTVDKIKDKLSTANIDMVLLTPGQYGSKTTYGLKNLAKKNPYGDVVTKNNNTTALMIKIIGAIKKIPKGNDYVYELKKALPERVKQCYWITKRNCNNLDSDFGKMQFDAVKLHQCWEKFDIEDPYFVRVAKWAEEKQLPLFIHVRSSEQMLKLISYIKKNPKLKIIIGHLYMLELFLEEDKKYFENTYFDFSNLFFVSKERMQKGIEHFGAKHFMLGSDTPYGKKSLELTVEQVMALDITEEEKNMILGGNMCEILGIN